MTDMEALYSELHWKEKDIIFYRGKLEECENAKREILSKILKLSKKEVKDD